MNARTMRIRRKRDKRAAKDTPRIVRRERRRAQTREEILEAARRVVMRDGPSATLDAVAAEVGLTKAALYYYFPSRDALVFELVYRIYEAEANAVKRAVEPVKTGAEALATLIRTTVMRHASRMGDFRLAFLAGQVMPEPVKMLPEYFARIRPLNDLTYGDATRKLEKEGGRSRSGVPPRRLAFLAHIAAIGLLTIKGMVEKVGDPLLYSDEQLISDLAKIFAAAAAPTG